MMRNYLTMDGTEEAEQPSDSPRVLVACFSATGNTESVANTIADLIGGDLFEITPADPYTSDDLNWTDENSRVVYEYENPEARDVELAEDTVDNWDEYDVVFVGYPIWWGIAAWPTDSFVEANDFRAETCWQNWPALGIGWRASASAAAPLRQKSRPGSTAWSCKRKAFDYESITGQRQPS